MSTTDSVSSVELNERNAEMAPRVISAVSTGTISAAAWRALSFSAVSGRLPAPAGPPPGPAAAAVAAPGAGAAPVLAAGVAVEVAVAGEELLAAAGAPVVGGGGVRLQPAMSRAAENSVI